MGSGSYINVMAIFSKHPIAETVYPLSEYSTANHCLHQNTNVQKSNIVSLDPANIPVNFEPYENHTQDIKMSNENIYKRCALFDKTKCGPFKHRHKQDYGLVNVTDFRERHKQSFRTIEIRGLMTEPQMVREKSSRKSSRTSFH